MARPKKSPQDRKTIKFAIPLTKGEMDRIAQAGALASSSGHTGWARDTLLKAADDLLRLPKPKRAAEPKDRGLQSEDFEVKIGKKSGAKD